LTRPKGQPTDREDQDAQVRHQDQGRQPFPAYQRRHHVEADSKVLLILDTC